jgi:hypothetical protein
MTSQRLRQQDGNLCPPHLWETKAASGETKLRLGFELNAADIGKAALTVKGEIALVSSGGALHGRFLDLKIRPVPGGHGNQGGNHRAVRRVEMKFNLCIFRSHGEIHGDQRDTSAKINLVVFDPIAVVGVSDDTGAWLSDSGRRTELTASIRLVASCGRMNLID